MCSVSIPWCSCGGQRTISLSMISPSISLWPLGDQTQVARFTMKAPLLSPLLGSNLSKTSQVSLPSHLAVILLLCLSCGTILTQLLKAIAPLVPASDVANIIMILIPLWSLVFYLKCFTIFTLFLAVYSFTVLFYICFSYS